MKRFLKRTLSVVLVVTLLFCAAPLNKNMFVAKAQSPYLTDAQIARYINLFYVPGSEAAQAAESILNGQSEGTVAEIKEICSNIGLFLGIAADVEIDNMTIQALGDLSVVTNAIVGVFNIIDNYQQMQSTQSALKKTVDGMQIAVSFLQVINLGSYISPSVSIALSVIDVTMNIAGYLEMQNVKEAVELYRAELMLDYYAGNELTFRTATDVSGWGISQETADSLYSAAYFEWYFKQCMDRIGNNTGEDTGSEPESKPVESVEFATNSYTMFFNSRLTNTAVAYPTDADDRSITYYSGNTSVAMVDSNGVVTPISPGTVNIVAEASNGVYDICTITILPYTASVNNGEFIILSYIGNESNVTIPSYIDGNINGKYIVGIGADAFRGCESITSVEIPGTVSVIGECAFSECPNLKSVIIPDSVTTLWSSVFSYCSNLKDVSLPQNLKTLSYGTFAYCTSLKDISLPNSITTVEDAAFFQCNNLTSLTLPENLEKINYGAFAYCSSLESVSLPNSLKTMGNEVFAYCSNLRSVTLPQNITTIPYGTFEYCSSLESIKIPDSVTKIEDYAFYDCSSIKEFSMPVSAQICNSENTFYNCSDIEKLTLTKGNGTMCDFNYNDVVPYITYYGYSPWYISRDNLKEVIVENGVENIGEYAFYDCSALTKVDLPDSLTHIKIYSFLGCSNLTSVNIPDNVVTIGPSAFADCKALKEVDFSSKLEKIEGSAFAGCNALSKIDFPNNLKEIGSSAFSNCDSLEYVVIPANVTSIGAGAFSGCDKLTYINVDSKNEYYTNDSVGVLFDKNKIHSFNILQVKQASLMLCRKV